MIQPTPVLPSNAPPLTDAEGSHVTRVLQEDSGNRQRNDYPYIDSSESKYPSSLPTENSLYNYPPQHESQHVSRHTPLQRHHYRYGHSRNGYDYADDQARREKQARFLCHRFQSSDQYMKYRSRQHKVNKSGDEQKWPDHLEMAFFQALVRWPPMGRRKLTLKDKQRGRNELIADHIEELTGEQRTRKQVSSHIQVLRPFVKHDPQITKWLSKEDWSSSQLARMLGGRATSYHDTRRASSYPIPKTPRGGQSAVPLMSQMELDHLSKMKSSLDVFEPVDFQMFMQRKYGKDQVERLHTYTASMSRPLQPDLQLHDCQFATDRQSHDCQSLPVDFPLLAAMHERRPLHCNILVAEASLAFPSHNFKDTNGVEVGISFLCSSRHLSANAVVHCQNNFYKDDRILKDHSGTNPVVLKPTEDGSMVETQLKFASTFWARNLAFLASRLRNNSDPSRNPREDVSAHIRGIAASQEIFVQSETGLERLLVIYWRFRLSSAAQGRACWTRVLLPPSSSKCAQKTERVDSVNGYELPFTRAPNSQYHHQSQPALLQPAFEYDSNSGSALTSATWPHSFETNLDTAPPSATDFNGDETFDFHGEHINLSFDPNLDFTGLDSSAFNFDAAIDFAADPVLQDYATHAPADYTQDLHEYAAQPTDYPTQWADAYSAAFDGQRSAMNSHHYSGPSAEPQSQAFDGCAGPYVQAYRHVGSDEQAYGGAGQDGNRTDDAFAALVSASYMAGATSHSDHQK